MDIEERENDFISLNYSIDVCTELLGSYSTPVRILKGLLKVMAAGGYEYNDELLSDLEELCR